MDNSSESMQSTSNKQSCSDQSTNLPSHQKHGESYWQVGKHLESSLSYMYENKLWTDVVFRCKKNLDDNTTDRVLAHRNILAARSPVFEVMLYGKFARDEIELNDVEAEIFDLVLRFVYTDETPLSNKNAVRVLEIAHRYELTPLVSYCAAYLYSILKPNGACIMLEAAVHFDLKTFRSKVHNFIDDNASEVLKSKGFLALSQQCLVAILERDTFTVDEKDIVERAMQWADRICTEKGTEATARNKREVLGQAFFQLRMTTLNMKDFLQFTRRNSYYTKEETEDICASIVGECDITPSTHNLVPRVPRKVKRIVPDKVVDCNTRFNYVNEIICVVEAKVTRKIHIEGLTLKNVLPYIGSVETDALYKGCNRQAANAPLPLHGKITIEGYSNNVSFEATPSKNNTVTLKKTFFLQPRAKPYRMSIELTYKCNSYIVLKATPSTNFSKNVSRPSSDSNGGNTTTTTDVLFTYSDTSKHVNCIKSVNVLNVQQGLFPMKQM
ncbi:BTB/POZ domain-containing protein 6-B-like [Mercenaria mercenaria]|uniref:BTB/POZ domain-containing protein 6-B-like n=1 Tax=Mercenaria mercenaria TaxID=6596 RepID=UPI00234EBDC1|nr:BTB/POZ domain-containing protein 6-B-like [Mercenaria mercenaria]